MAILSVAVLAKTGKVLVARQFVQIARQRLDGVLAAFPKLVSSSERAASFIETETVRYVFQPLDALYLLLLTTKKSNITEDLETLALLAKIVPEQCRTLREADVLSSAFELLFAFDELITEGNRERVSLAQLKTFVAMDSAEERAWLQKQREQEQHVHQLMQQRAEEIRRQREEGTQLGRGGGVSSSGVVDMPLSGGASGSGRLASASSQQSRPSQQGGRGLNLGGKKGAATDAVVKQMVREGAIDVRSVSAAAAKAGPAAAASAGGAAAAAATAQAIQNGVQCSVVEHVTCALLRDGGVQNLEVRGELSVTVYGECSPFVKVALTIDDDDMPMLKTHPNIDRNEFAASRVLQSKDAARPLPKGSPLELLRWRLQSQEEGLVPLVVNCWPSQLDSSVSVAIEYELTEGFALRDVVIEIPTKGCSSAPVVQSVECGEAGVSAKTQQVEWHLDAIGAHNRTGSMEFRVPAADLASFFPIAVRFVSSEVYCNLAVAGVTDARSGAELPFVATKHLDCAGGYSIV